jgi:hypothetical protein
VEVDGSLGGEDRWQAAGDTAADRLSRGRVGLDGSAPRIAFESWLFERRRPMSVRSQ